MRVIGKNHLTNAVTKLITSVIALLLAVPSLGHAYPRPGDVRRVDIPQRGGSTEGNSAGGSLSADGRFVAFSSSAPLVPEDTNGLWDIYVRDMNKGITELISRSPHGLPAVGPTPALGHSMSPVITPDGRYVAFDSEATNLVPGDTNLTTDVFVFDRKTRSMEMISVDSRGAPADAAECRKVRGQFACSYLPSISANGRHVSFTSWAPLVADDSNDSPDVFVRDRRSGRTLRASLDSQGREVTPCAGLLGSVLQVDPTSNCVSWEWHSSIDASGRYVAFNSLAWDLVEDDTNETWDVFVRDLKKGTTERVSVASDGSEVDVSPVPGRTNPWDGSRIPIQAISRGGRYVLFSSGAVGLVPNDANKGLLGGAEGGGDAFVHDRRTGRTERISVSSSGAELNRSGDWSRANALSANGRYAVFACVCEDAQEEEGVDDTYFPFVYDRLTGALHRVPVKQDDFWGLSANLSPSGRFAGFVKSDEGDDAGGFSRASSWRADMGDILGIGGFGGSPPTPNDEEDDRICIEGTCIPPQAAVSFSGGTSDLVGRVLTERGANLIGGAIAYRPALGDLYISLELASMPRTPVLATATAGIVYGMSFDTGGRSYEIRSVSTGLGAHGETTAAFGLFDCSTDEPLCSKVKDLKGGFGTTGERVIFSVPLDELGIGNRSVVSDVKAFTALGGYGTGTTRILDSLRIK